MPERQKTPIESPAELVQRAMREFESPLIGYAISILGDVERARDAVQDTFLKLYQQEEGKVNQGLKAWLFTVCRNRSFDMIRKDRRLTHVDDEILALERSKDPDPYQATQRREAHSEVMRFLERLPENQREVIRLKFQNDLSYKEISEITDLSVSNVGFLIHTGIKRLRGLLAHQSL